MLPLFRRWQRTVDSVQRLPTEQAHDVARLICDLEPVTSPVSTLMVKLAADIQAIAIQISQRRTFMERYTQDLEMALHRRSPSFNRPPIYAGVSSDTSEQQIQQNRPSSQYDNDIALPTPAATTLPQAGNAQVAELNIPDTRNEEVMIIRETLYAVLADVMSQSKTLGVTLSQDPARG